MNLRKVKDERPLVHYSLVERLFDENGSVGDDYIIKEGLSWDEALEALYDEEKKIPKESRTKAGQQWYTGNKLEGFWFTDSNDNVIAVFLKCSMYGLSPDTKRQLITAEQEAKKNAVTDSVAKEQTIVFHSTQSTEELADIIIKKKFQAGRGGGKMLGPGFYANQHLRQAQKGNYGRYILKARIFGISDFLFLDKKEYEIIHGPASDDFVWEQIAKKGLGDLITKDWIRQHANLGSTARLASPLYEKYGSKLMKAFGGFVYTGLWDKESVVCWKPERQVQPIGWSDDKGATWKPIKDLEAYASADKDENLNSSELVRSLQRARDIIARYEKYDDAKIAHAINSQLARIKDKAKREVRRMVIVKLLSEQRPSAADLVESEV